jgi:hypothetical protein
MLECNIASGAIRFTVHLRATDAIICSPCQAAKKRSDRHTRSRAFLAHAISCMHLRIIGGHCLSPKSLSVQGWNVQFVPGYCEHSRNEVCFAVAIVGSTHRISEFERQSFPDWVRISDQRFILRCARTGITLSRRVAASRPDRSRESHQYQSCTQECRALGNMRRRSCHGVSDI